METRPPANHSWIGRFIIQVTQGLVRDERTRRTTTAILIVVAAVMVAVGLAGLRSWLEPKEHTGRFILFWFACGWVTLTASLLALLDLLMVRAKARQVRKALREDALKRSDANSVEQ
jgi:drug/metabolite transporter (DMT)-like permease